MHVGEEALARDDVSCFGPVRREISIDARKRKDLSVFISLAGLPWAKLILKSLILLPLLSLVSILLFINKID